MRITIERLRTMVLASGVLLAGLLALFLIRGRLRNPFNVKELPQKLGINIQSDATTFTIDHALGGHSRYRIRAAKAVQYKDNRAILKDVHIELYGEDGALADRIEGAEFDYDQKNGAASASGPVDITLIRPAKTKPDKAKPEAKNSDSKRPTPLASAAQAAEQGEIHVKTSGLTFDTKSGVANTAARLDFSTAQGSGSAIGASYDSKGLLVLNDAVELNTTRGNRPVAIHARHAEFEREMLACNLHEARANYRGGEATAGDAKVLFRNDGTAVELDASNGFSLKTATGGKITAPRGVLQFAENNEPRHGHLQGGVVLDFDRDARQVHATAPNAEFDFSSSGELQRAHFERGVEMRSDQRAEAKDGPVHVSRNLAAPVADVEFRDNGHGQIEPAEFHGSEGVVVTGETVRGNGPVLPSRLAADDLHGTFAENSELKSMTGIGHASLEQTNAQGVKQTSSGDKLDVQFSEPAKGKPSRDGQSSLGQIQSATLDGHVNLTQTPVAKANAAARPGLRAWAGHAAYDSEGEWLHLTANPRVEDGGMQMTADKIDVSRASGEAFAHGNVKASWQSAANQADAVKAGAASQQVLNGRGTTHCIATDAKLSRTSDGSRDGSSEATFSGHARLWDDANSVSAPAIVINRDKRTLAAHSGDANEPVCVVLLSSGAVEARGASSASNEAKAKTKTPTVIRLRGGDLKYSDAENQALMRGGALGTVVAETPSATSVSNEVELVTLPRGNHAGANGVSAQVDRMTASGHVVVTAGGRQGTGERLDYSGEAGTYTLTGSSSAPPRMTDPARGTVTGDALVFHSGDDRIVIEGGSGRTTTETTTPK